MCVCVFVHTGEALYILTFKLGVFIEIVLKLIIQFFIYVVSDKITIAF